MTLFYYNGLASEPELPEEDVAWLSEVVRERDNQGDIPEVELPGAGAASTSARESGSRSPRAPA